MSIPADSTPGPTNQPGEHGIAGASAPEAAVTSPKAERTIRGLLMSLIVIPLGAVAWVILWNMGFIASIVSALIGAAAVFLYSFGAKQPLTKTAFWGLLVVIISALAVSFLAGVGIDIAKAMEIDPAAALLSPDFWDTYWLNIFDNPKMWETYVNDIVMAVLFSALGVFSVVRSMARNVNAQR